MPAATNPMFAKFDEALGATSPTVAHGPTSSRADEIMALGSQAATPTQGYTGRAADAMGKGADTVGKGFADAGKSIAGNFDALKKNNASADPLTKILNTLQFAGHTAGDVAGAAGNIAVGTAKAAAAPLTQIQTSEGDTVGQRFATPIKNDLSGAVEALKTAHPEVVKWLSQQAEAHPDIAKGIGDLVNTIGLTGGGKLLSADVPALGEAASTIKGAAGDVAQAAKGATQAVASPIKTARTALQTAAGKGKILLMEGVGQQAQTSASRLAEKYVPGGAGAAVKTGPLRMYDNFAAQEAKHLADIKHDPAISLVGDRIGDAFGKVVKQRQQVGKTMSAELAKTADKTVDTGAAFGNLQKELLDNGVTYDSVNKQLSAGSASKFSEADNAVLEKYAGELQKIGSTPTMAQLDAFISRIPKDIKTLKATRNINFKTNAERIIGNNLNDLRDALGKVGTKKYSAARAQYANLSQFINEGSSHLGKVTQSGDFAKDASLAKSAVQSVLNNGKKDWLIKLEQHTGYSALDEATLALQAMKDAGDFKGNSLLELLTEGADHVPTSPSGIAGKVLGFLGKQAGKAVAGSKAEQTRAFLKSLEQKR